MQEDIKIMILQTTPPYSNFSLNISSSQARINNIPIVSLNISSCQARIKLHTENPSPSLFSSGDSCEEDVKNLGFGRRPHNFSNIFMVVMVE